MPINPNDPKYKAISDLFQSRSASIQQHHQMLEDEVRRHDGTHAFGRHGYQSGWEAQVVRACTQITPDQSFDPRGLGPTIRRWNVNDVTYTGLDEYGDPIEELLGLDIDYSPEESDYKKSPGEKAGGFITPGAQQKALNKAAVLGTQIGQWDAAQYIVVKAHNQLGKKLYTPITSVAIVVGNDGSGDFYGLSFSRNSRFKQRTRKEVVELIEGFKAGKTWDQLVPGHTAMYNKFHVKNQSLQSLDDLFLILGLDVETQPYAKIIYRRDCNMKKVTFEDWRMITAYPTDDAPGWKPQLYFNDKMKANMKKIPKKDRLPLGADFYKWTGLTFKINPVDKKITKTETHTVPTW